MNLTAKMPVQVFGFNPILAANFNADFDGDQMGVFALQSTQAYRDFYNIFSGATHNIKKYFDPESYLPDLVHEAIYSIYTISKWVMNTYNNDDQVEQSFLSIKDVKITSSNLDKLNKPVYIAQINKKMSWFFALVNKTVLQFDKDPDKIIIESKVYSKKNKKEIYDAIASVSKNGIDFLNRLFKLNQFLTELSSLENHGIPTLDTDELALSFQDAEEFKKQFVVEPVIGFHQNMYLFEKIIMDNLENYRNGENILNKLYKSGSRLKSIQLMKATTSTGIPTDVQGHAEFMNISTPLIDGLSPEELFAAGGPSRRALAERESKIPQSGALQRTLMSSLGFIKLDHNVDDCGSTKGLKITIKDKKHLKSLDGRSLVNGGIINKNDTDLIGQTVEIFSPITCKLENFKICKKCFGKHLPPADKKGMSYIGGLTASAIVEQLLQAGLRLHHTGGTWEMESTYPEIYKLFDKGVKFGVDEIDGEQVSWMQGEQEDYNIIKSILVPKYYSEEEIEFIEKDDKMYIIPHKNLESQGSGKTVTEFSRLIFKKRDAYSSKEEDQIIPVEEFYDKVISTLFEGAYLLSVYIESIIGTLFFDDEMINIRYSDKPATLQLSANSLITQLDPKLNAFHKLSNLSLKNIFEHEGNYELDHMIYELLRAYK